MPLTADHFEAAAKYPNAFDVIRFAFEAEASVREMEAWARHSNGMPPLVERKPKKTSLFEESK